MPRTYTEYTRRRVLTSQWIDGEKLSQSKADDVASLVNVGVVCYLKQLLDTGFFMADPHPGAISLAWAPLMVILIYIALAEASVIVGSCVGSCASHKSHYCISQEISFGLQMHASPSWILGS